MADKVSIGEGGSWITRLLTADDTVRVIVVEATEVADILREAHELGPRAATMAAQAAVATLLVSAHVKGEEKLTLQMGLQRPTAKYIGELDPQHRFRARFTPSNLDDNVDIDHVDGLLFATKHDGRSEVYKGVTSIDGVSIAQALRGHLSDSTQVSATLCMGVRLGDDGHVEFAGGVLVERLPAHAKLPFLEPEEFLSRYGTLGEDDPQELIAEIHSGTLRTAAVRTVAQRPVIWMCTCSKERVMGALVGLGPDELVAMAHEDGGASVSCHFCNATYTLTAQELLELAGRLKE